MLKDGLVEEVKGLQQEGCHRGMVSMQGLGYKEILAYLEGEYDLERAVYLIKRDTRALCKAPADLVSPGKMCNMG